jgi:hypothetical protein
MADAWVTVVGNKEVRWMWVDEKGCRTWFVLGVVRNVRDNGDEVSDVNVLSWR